MQKGYTLPHNMCPEYATKQLSGGGSVLEFRDVEYLFIAYPSWSPMIDVVAPDRVLFISQIELFDHLNCMPKMTYAELNC